MSLDQFRHAYVEACDGANPHPHVLTQCDQGTSSGDKLLCSGNARGAVLNVAKALRTSHPFAVVDLSCNTWESGSGAALAGVLQNDVTMEVLDLHNSDLGPADAEIIGEAIAENATLRELSLSGNSVGAEGALAIANSLQKNSSLKVLRVGSCDLDTRGIIAIATALHGNVSLQHLDISRPLVAPAHMTEALDHLSRMLSVNRALTQLDLSKCGVRDDGLAMLASALRRAGPNSRLSTLCLRCNEISLRETDAVREFGQLLSSYGCPLAHLDLSANRLHDEGALLLSEMLHSNSTLSHIDVRNNSIASRGLCALGPILASHRSLTSAAVWGNRFDSAACRSWLPALSGRLSLDFSVQEVDGTYSCVAAA
jgi:Ran GTPase-activating protein (RanGAP) involved in mRNA processing and transport